MRIFRIGDVLNEKLKVPQDYKSRIVSVEKYCTKLELEILLIIAENMMKQYEKTKSTVRPKDFAKQHIRCGKRKYDNSSEFYQEYFGERTDLLVSVIKEYKRIKGKHEKDEKYLADLLR